MFSSRVLVGGDSSNSLEPHATTIPSDRWTETMKDKLNEQQLANVHVYSLLFSIWCTRIHEHDIKTEGKHRLRQPSDIYRVMKRQFKYLKTVKNEYQNCR